MGFWAFPKSLFLSVFDDYNIMYSVEKIHTHFVYIGIRKTQEKIRNTL